MNLLQKERRNTFHDRNQALVYGCIKIEKYVNF